MPIGSSVGSASGGRARSNVCLRIVTRSAAVPIARSPAANARGLRRRQAASPQAPIAAISGHFTHQVDASRKTTVSGPQRSDSAKEDAAASRPPIASSTAATVPG
jgi:hypothetical protein